jgi:hypothetical protein
MSSTESPSDFSAASPGEEAKTHIDQEIAHLEETLRQLLAQKRAMANPPPPSTPRPSTPTHAVGSTHVVTVPDRPVSAAPKGVVQRQLAFNTVDQVKVHITTPNSRRTSSPIDPSDPTTSDSAPSRLRPIKADAPKKFGGTERQRATAHDWLLKAQNWLELAGRGEDEATLVKMFATVLEDSAERWFFALRRKEELMRRSLSLQKVFDDFVLKFESGTSRVVLQKELDNLIYGKNSCRDIYATDAEFDRLVGALYPHLDDDSPWMPLLAEKYANIFQRGDVELWGEAAKQYPNTVDDWRVAIQRAYTIRQVLTDARRPTRGTFSSAHHASSSSPSYRTPTVAVNQMQGQTTIGEANGDTQTWERQEGEAESQAEQLQHVTAAKKGPKMVGSAEQGQRNTGGDFRRRYGNHLTADERAALVKVGRCFNCIERGHIASRCPNLDKPTFPRKPTRDQLNE